MANRRPEYSNNVVENNSHWLFCFLFQTGALWPGPRMVRWDYGLCYAIPYTDLSLVETEYWSLIGWPCQQYWFLIGQVISADTFKVLQDSRLGVASAPGGQGVTLTVRGLRWAGIGWYGHSARLWLVQSGHLSCDWWTDNQCWPIRRSDGGQYTCALNTKTSVLSTTHSLNIEGKKSNLFVAISLFQNLKSNMWRWLDTKFHHYY